MRLLRFISQSPNVLDDPQSVSEATFAKRVDKMFRPREKDEGQTSVWERRERLDTERIIADRCRRSSRSRPDRQIAIDVHDTVFGEAGASPRRAPDERAFGCIKELHHVVALDDTTLQTFIGRMRALVLSDDTRVRSRIWRREAVRECIQRAPEGCDELPLDEIPTWMRELVR